MDEDYIFEVAAGTYEEFLVCYNFSKQDTKYQLTHSVASHSHKSSIRSIACTKNILVTGGADEVIHIYDLLERREQGMLSHHSGTVSCLEFSSDGAYLMTGSEDGSLALVKVGSWKVQHMWEKAHKGQAVTGFSIHPSGKLALSVGQDKMIRTWNLVTGRRAFTVSLGKRCGTLNSVSWSTAGTYYVIPYGRKVDVYETNSTTVEHEVTVPTKVTSVCFLKDHVLVIGEQSGDVSAHECSSGREIWRMKPGEERIRALAARGSHLVTAGSLGTISVYETSKEPPELAASFDSKCRITCIALSNPKSDLEDWKAANISAKVKRKEKRGKAKEAQRMSFPAEKETQTEKRRKLDDNIVYCSPSSQTWKIQNTT